MNNPLVPPFKVGDLVVHLNSMNPQSQYTITKIYWVPYRESWKVDLVDADDIRISGNYAKFFELVIQELEPLSWWESISE